MCFCGGIRKRTALGECLSVPEVVGGGCMPFLTPPMKQKAEYEGMTHLSYFPYECLYVCFFGHPNTGSFPKPDSLSSPAKPIASKRSQGGCPGELGGLQLPERGLRGGARQRLRREVWAQHQRTGGPKKNAESGAGRAPAAAESSFAGFFLGWKSKASGNHY